MKIITIINCLLFSLPVIAQKGINGLIQAEKKFAAYSVANNTKDAFLKFADSAGIVFENGKPVNAMQAWNKKEKRPGTLNWSPLYAEVVTTGDFGYTTGPWDFSINDTVKANGYYITVWHINKNGEWKFLVDLGVSDINCDFSRLEKNVFNNDSQIKEAEFFLKQAEENMISGFQKNGKAIYENFLSENSRLYRNSTCEASHPDQRHWIIDSLPLNIQYTINGSGIANNGNLGFVYGSTIINGQSDNYLRIWRREDSGWKIAVEVLRY